MAGHRSAFAPRPRSNPVVSARRADYGRLFLCGLALSWNRLVILQYRPRAAAARRGNRKRDRSEHEDNRAPGSRLGEHRSRAARSERRLAAHTAKCGCDITALTALQQHHNNQEETNQNVNDRNQH